jgi:small subunit ribosomal protein S6
LNQYEAMFLFDPTFGASQENCEREVHRLLERAKAEVLFSGRWDERRLAYKIKGRKRGVYWLTYFKAPPDRIPSLERDAQISENLLRVLIVRADDVTPELMEKFARARGADLTPSAPPAGGVEAAGPPQEHGEAVAAVALGFERQGEPAVVGARED